MILPETKNPRVLIIDDELGPRESLRILLKKKYEVLCADSVVRGLDILKESKPDVVVSDIRMPGLSGIDGLKRIREIDNDVPVIMLTGYGSLETAQEAIRHGASDYMKKPFDANDMLAIIKRNVERSELIKRREQSRQTLEKLNADLLEEISKKSRLASMGQASAELVHDLRNPMMIILGYVQLLSQDVAEGKSGSTNLPPDTEEYMAAIEQNVRRCKDLIESWLDLSRSNRMSLKPVNLNEIIHDSVDTLRPLAYGKQASITCQLPPDAMGILGHGVQLKRAIHNLVGNAIDALPGSEGQILVIGEEKNGKVSITISDNGEGIEARHIPHIFEPFYSSKEPGKGSGLGLFITQKIIEDHNGEVFIDSTHGHGTRVTITFPALEEAKQAT
ncbi:MAG TPA: hybrid sensor histidine kinase/response regulator [Kiritimatiellia bacterium]|nr:hybrid sensor histidine kinase/response regulator [Kiritimatiellia bacterium]